MNFTDNLPLWKVRRIILSRRGEVRRIARELGKTPTAVSLTLLGKSKSAEIQAAVYKRAAEISEADAAA